MVKRFITSIETIESSRKNVGIPAICEDAAHSYMRHTSPGEVVRHRSYQGIYFLLFPSPKRPPPTKQAVAFDGMLRKGIAPGSQATGTLTYAIQKDKSKGSTQRVETWVLEKIPKRGRKYRVIWHIKRGFYRGLVVFLDSKLGFISHGGF